MTHKNIASEHRLLVLDILRGLAILLVLGRHILVIPETLPRVLSLPLLLWREIGWVGVDLFFVISGFLVSRLIFSEFIKTKSISIGNFLIRRGFKIYPLFYLFTCFAVISSILFDIPSTLAKSNLIGEVLFLQNYLGMMWSHTWSLAVEEHFYIILAAVLFILYASKKKDSDPFNFIPQLVFALGVTILILRIAISSYYPPLFSLATFALTHFRIDSLFFGVLISYYFNFRRESLATFVINNRTLLTILAGLVLCIPLLFPINHYHFTHTFGFTFIYLGCGSALLLCLHYNFSILNLKTVTKPLVWIGRQSYSIYLWHLMIYKFTYHLISPENTPLFCVQLATYLSISVLVGKLMTQAVETPMLRIRDRFFPSRSH